MSNWGDFGNAVENEMIEAALAGMHEEHAQGVAQAARDAGLKSADEVVIEIEEVGAEGDPRLTIDVDRVRRRANEILAGS